VITIVVPTLNRPDFMIRTMRYYAEAGFLGCLLVGDSSRGEAAARVRDEAVRLSGRVDVTVHDCVDLDDRLTLQKLSELVKTPYVAYIGDDDLILPSGIRDCVEFLERERQFISANGSAWAFELLNGATDTFGRLRVLDAYPQPEVLHADAVSRLTDYLRDYRVSLFSVTRSAAWKRAWQHSRSVPDRAFAAELLPGCLIAALGRIRHLTTPYLLRQSAHAVRYHLPHTESWYERPEWHESFRLFCEVVGSEISEQDGIERRRAERLVADAFQSGYFQPLLARVRRAAPPVVDTAGPLRRVARSIPGARSVWRKLFKAQADWRLWRASRRRPSAWRDASSAARRDLSIAIALLQGQRNAAR
jgi:glycosyltransferase domain-containing protein